MFQQIVKAIRQVFSERKYVVIFFGLVLFFFLLFVLIPVFTIPGNSLAFQLSIFRPQDYFLMLLLAFLVGLNFSMNLYSWQKRKRMPILNSAAGSAASGLGGAFAAIVGSASCASCLASLFSIVGLGFGSVAFVLRYQIYFVLGAIALVAISLYFTAKKINNVCSLC